MPAAVAAATPGCSAPTPDRGDRRGSRVSAASGVGTPGSSDATAVPRVAARGRDDTSRDDTGRASGNLTASAPASPWSSCFSMQATNGLEQLVRDVLHDAAAELRRLAGDGEVGDDVGPWCRSPSGASAWIVTVRPGRAVASLVLALGLDHGPVRRRRRARRRSPDPV